MVFDRKAYMKVYNKERYENNKEKIIERSRKQYENNKEYIKEYNKEYKENNKEHIKEKDKEYRQSEHGQMFYKISIWIHRGVIYYDMKELYYIVKMTKYCHYCWTLLVEGMHGANKKCLDHDHETGEPRGVICHTCNTKDVFRGC